MDGNLNPKAFEPYVQRTVGFGEAIKRAYKNYFNFSGRASLSEYWWFTLYANIVSMIACSLMMASPFMFKNQVVDAYLPLFWSVIFGAIFVATIVLNLPGLSLLVRRLHDIGKGGGWIFISFVPFIGGIWLLVLTLQPSEPYANRFGPIPNAQPLA